MSTTAIIVCQNENGNYDGISVHFDGYIDNGVGEDLITGWNNSEEIKKLCSSDKQIRCFSSSCEDIEYFTSYGPIEIKNIKALKNISYDDMINQSANFDYAYWWIQDESTQYNWMLWEGGSRFSSVKQILNKINPNTSLTA